MQPAAPFRFPFLFFMLVAPRLTLSWQNFPADLDSGCVLMLGLQVRAKPSAGLWVL